MCKNSITNRTYYHDWKDEPNFKDPNCEIDCEHRDDYWFQKSYSWKSLDNWLAEKKRNSNLKENFMNEKLLREAFDAGFKAEQKAKY